VSVSIGLEKKSTETELGVAGVTDTTEPVRPRVTRPDGAPSRYGDESGEYIACIDRRRHAKSVADVRCKSISPFPVPAADN